MKAIQLQAFGKQSESLRLVEVPDVGAPGPDEVILALEASPITGSDLSVIAGSYGQLPALPSIGGFEGVGRVVAVGRDVTFLAEGELTLIPPLQPAWAERIKTRADWLRPLPDGDVKQLSMLGINPATAYLMLTETVSLAPGAWVIQNAANSAVGRAVIAIARSRGLRTVNVVRRPELIEEIEAIGGDVVLVDGPDLAQQVAKATSDAPVVLALDTIGGDATLRLMSAVAPGGSVVMYGNVSRQPLQASVPQLVFTDLTIRGFWLVEWFKTATLDKLVPMYEELADLVASGAITVPIAATYSFEQYADAIDAAAQWQGKVLLTPHSDGLPS